MRTLIYKRTHPGDPDETGQFGIHDCMGQVRTWEFDAVIGVGGQGAEPRRHKLDGKVNWIGIGPRRGRWYRRGPIVTFDHFYFRGAAGPDFEKLAPFLAERIYSRNVRVVMDGLSVQEHKEVDKILALAKRAPASPGRRFSNKPATGCSR
jgi:hypothetical protein